MCTYGVQVRINYHNGSTNIKTFGQNQEVCEVETATTSPNIYDYVGDVVIRKFPYGMTSNPDAMFVHVANEL